MLYLSQLMIAHQQLESFDDLLDPLFESLLHGILARPQGGTP